MCSPSLTYPSSFCSLLAYYLCKYIHPTLRTHLHICRLWSISTITCCMSRVFFHAVNSRMPVLFGISPNNSWPLFSFLVICSSTTEVSTPLSPVAPPPPLPPQKCLSLECVPPMFRRFFCIFLNNIPTPSVYICECAPPFFVSFIFLWQIWNPPRYISYTYRPKVVPRKIFIHLFSAKNNKLTTRVWSLVVVPTPTTTSVCVCWFCPLWCTLICH